MRSNLPILQLWLLLALAFVAGCGAMSDRDRLRTETIQRYEATVRWNQFDAMVDFMHPDWLEENPVSSLDIDRLHQFRVSQYSVRQVMSVPEDGVDRLVQLRIYNKHTARERVVDYVEAWRWDEERERWMLHSGLPDVTGKF